MFCRRVDDGFIFLLNLPRKGNFRDSKGAHKSHIQLLSLTGFFSLFSFCSEQSTATPVVAHAHHSCWVFAVISLVGLLCCF